MTSDRIASRFRLCFVAFVIASSWLAKTGSAQTSYNTKTSYGSKDLYAHAIIEKFPLTIASDDKTTIVTPGPMVVLKKDNLTLYALTYGSPADNEYRDRNTTLQQNYTDFNATDGYILCVSPGGKPAYKFLPDKWTPKFFKNPDNGFKEKVFNKGDKLWLLHVQRETLDMVTMTLLSEPIDGVRYGGTIEFHFPGLPALMPTPEDFAERVSLVFDVDPATAVSAQPAATKSQPTITLGEGIGDVLMALGAPTKTVELGTKEILFYKDMKITFINSKVTDVQ